MASHRRGRAVRTGTRKCGRAIRQPVFLADWPGVIAAVAVRWGIHNLGGDLVGQECDGWLLGNIAIAIGRLSLGRFFVAIHILRGEWWLRQQWRGIVWCWRNGRRFGRGFGLLRVIAYWRRCLLGLAACRLFRCLRRIILRVVQRRCWLVLRRRLFWLKASIRSH